MSDTKQGEEKFVVERRVLDNPLNKLGTYHNSVELSAHICRCVVTKTDTYMLGHGVTDNWFDFNIYTNHPKYSEHVMLSLAIEEININAIRGSARDVYRFHQWGVIIRRLNNTIAFCLYDNGSRRDSTDAEIKRFSVKRFSDKIKLALELLFDAHYPED